MLRQLDETEKRIAGGVVVVEGYGKEERVEEFSAEEDDQVETSYVKKKIV